jgi:hypothetical protein
MNVRIARTMIMAKVEILDSPPIRSEVPDRAVSITVVFDLRAVGFLALRGEVTGTRIINDVAAQPAPNCIGGICNQADCTADCCPACHPHWTR